MAISKFTLENGLQVTGSSNFSGSVSSSGGFTGSLFGTASYGQDANLLDGLDSTAFARLASANIFTQTQTVSGNLYVTGTVSASVVTASQGFVSGGLTIGNYVQLLPVGAINIPANLSASYIYTSGSTNDMYFTQYQGPFTNTTRLRWLESTLSTGLLHGGIISTVNGTTAFSVTSGSGLIINYNASTDSDPYPTINFVSWPTYTSQSLLYSGSAQITYIAIASDGTISQETLPPNFSEYKDRIVLGRVLHQSGSVANGAINTSPTAYGLATSTADFIRAIGPLKISGHYLAPSGSGNLSLTKSAGDSYVEGRNYSLNPNIPNVVLAANDPAVTVSKIYRQFISGGNPQIDTGVAGAGYTTVDPSKYQDANGNLAAVGSSNFSIQRVYWFPRSVNKALFVYYGQAIYANMDDAIEGINTETFVEGDNTKGSAILVAHLVMKGNISNFNSTTTSRIYQAGLFRGGAGGGGGGGVSGGATNLASLTDVSLGTPANGQALVYNTSISKWVEGYPNSASFATNAATASYIASGSAIATFTNDVRNQFSAGNNIGISDGVVSLSSSVSTTAVTGTTGVSGALGLFPVLTGSSVSGTTAQFTVITGSAISGALIGTLNTISVINAGSNLTASNVGSIRTLALTSSVAGLTSLSSTTGSFTILTGSTTTGSTALFTIVTGSAISGSTLSYTTLNTTQMTSSGKILVDSNVTIGNGKNRTATDIGIGIAALNSTDANTNYNTAVGGYALTNNTSGTQNTAVGFQSLISNVGGGNNVGIGVNSLYLNTSGNNNVAIGNGAGLSNTGQGDNIFIGLSSGYNSQGSFNSFIGNYAGRYSVSNQNVAIGYYALNSHKGTAGNNFALGALSVQTLISGGENIGIGVNSMQGVTNGDGNIAIGNRTMAAALTYGPAGSIVTASYNTAIGYNSLGAMLTGSENISIGYNSTLYLGSGSYNHGVGTSVLSSLRTGSANTAYGYRSLHTLLTGSSNVAIGNLAGSSILTGSGNVIIGSAGGTNNTNNNIYVADGAGNLRLQVDSNGVLDVKSGQIKFPAAQTASSDVNTLDDYEEGFWTPAFSGSTTTNFTYDTAATSGSYVKIGKNVSLNGYIKISSTGSSAGDLYIQNLPFAFPAGAVNFYSLNVGYHANLGGTVLGPMGRGALGSSVIVLSKNTVSTASPLNVTDLTNDASIMFGINYNVS
jgi:hypothetical protein